MNYTFDKESTSSLSSDLPQILHDHLLSAGPEALLPDGRIKILDALGAALAYKHVARCSIIPTRMDSPNEKRPAIKTWEEYQTAMMPDAMIADTWRTDCLDIAVLCGKTSGDLEILDIESEEMWQALRAKIGADKCEVLFDVFYIVRTPKGGRHLYYRCPGHVQGAQKLASKRLADLDVNGWNRGDSTTGCRAVAFGVRQGDRIAQAVGAVRRLHRKKMLSSAALRTTRPTCSGRHL